MQNFTDFSTLININEDGGKGHHLKELVSMGFNVPKGLVIGSSFYSHHYPEPPVFDFDNEEKLELQCHEMVGKVESMSLPEDFMEDLKQTLKNFEENTRFAVRSSSTYEDLSSAAFAGQHETYLNVSMNNLNSKIQECFASLWQKHAVLYRRHQGFDQKNASMAVVIQRMISAETAGVAFSVDPVSGNLSHVLIEANFGIGESVVGGETVTDSWIVDSSTWNIFDRRISEKVQYVVTNNEGIETKELPEEYKNKPCLSDEQIIEIAKTVKQIEKGFNSPQDVEWAYDNNNLYILQSRPQTTIPPHFTRDESAERYPDPLTPLTWSYAEEAFNNSLEYSLNMMNITLPTRPWFAMKSSYIYGNQNAVKLLSMNKLIDIKNLDSLTNNLSNIQRKLKWVFELPNTWMRDLDKYLLSIGKLKSKSFDSFSLEDFQQYFKDLFDIANDYFKPNIAISMTQAFLTKALFECIATITGNIQEAQVVLKQIASSANTKTGQINRELYEMALMVRENQALFELLSKGSKEAIISLHEFEEFSKTFNTFIENYGHREITFDYYIPTWTEAPWVVLDLILLTATSNQAEDPLQKEQLTKMQSSKVIQELLFKTPKELQYFISELIRLTNAYTYLDDLEHFQTTRVNVLARKVAGAFGERFFDNNQLEDKYDIFFLTKEEIEAITCFEMSVDLKSKIAQRKIDFFEACDREPKLDLNETDEKVEENSDNFKGIPGSPGECEGEIYLVRGPEDFSGMPNNTIIVARTTNPAWTPLFYKAKGLITESGGPLSHGAVTARELGLPAVMCIRNALKLFENGMHVRIDGQKGMVMIL